jgi:hypothetical protein
VPFRSPSAAADGGFTHVRGASAAAVSCILVYSSKWDAKVRANGLPAGLLIEEEMADECSQDVCPHDRFQ